MIPKYLIISGRYFSELSGIRKITETMRKEEAVGKQGIGERFSTINANIPRIPSKKEMLDATHSSKADSTALGT